MKKLLLIIVMLLLSSNSMYSQVAINIDGSTPDSSAILDLKSTSKGLLIPRMTTPQRDAIIRPAAGLLIYCLDFNNLSYNRGTPETPEWAIIECPWQINDTNIYYFNGNVGIGTSTPECKLTLNNDGSLMAKGIPYYGATMTPPGIGTRMIWYPKKGAFRAGNTVGYWGDTTIWNDENIGMYSIAMGDGSKASGISSFAINSYTNAIGGYSTAMGSFTHAYGQYSTAIGLGSDAHGDYSIATGLITHAFGEASISMGRHTKANGDYSTSLGDSTFAFGRASVSMGYSTVVNSFASLSIGRYNMGGGNDTLWLDSDPLFEIGNGTGPNSKNNAMTVLKSGNVGIGIASPASSALLDLSSSTKGFLPPRMSISQRDAISTPVEGLVIYNTDEKTLNVFNGTSWGLLSPVVCGQPFKDPRNNKIYNTVQIGTQCWMAQNLNLGTRINGSLDQTNNGTIEKYCYNNLETNCDIYGGLYQWGEMMQYTNVEGIQGICPTGWHIPSDAEWTTLTTYLGGVSISGGKMKETGTTHWASPNTGATNSSGFTALPGGGRSGGVFYYSLTYTTLIWSSSQYDAYDSWSRRLYNDNAGVTKQYNYMTDGFSVRCIQN